MKSGPTFAGAALTPFRASARSNPRVTVVLPWPVAGAARMMPAGPTALFELLDEFVDGLEELGGPALERQEVGPARQGHIALLRGTDEVEELPLVVLDGHRIVAAPDQKSGRIASGS